VSNAPVGSYAITPGLALGPGLTNYAIGYSNGTLFVSAASLLITAHDTNKVYGATLTPVDYSVTGLLNGDSVTNVTLASPGGVSNAPVGSYAITPGLALGPGLTNYAIGYSNGALIVSAANLLITAHDTNKVYGATLTPVDYSVAGLLNGDSVTNVTLASPGDVSNAPVGSYAITPGLALGPGLTNYGISYSNGTLTVGAAALTITASNAAKVEGSTVAFVGTELRANGLLNTDSVTNATLSSIGAASGAPVGLYPITITNALGSGLSNYAIAYVQGTLTVTNPEPEFRITSVIVAAGLATVTWNSVPGCQYRLLYKDDLPAVNWSVVPVDQVATGVSTSHTNILGSSPARFYRVQNVTNSAPVLPVLGDMIVPEFTTLVVTNTATDPNQPAELLAYALTEAPTNATISLEGIIIWTPGEDQGGSTNIFTTVVTDNGGLKATNRFAVVVTEVNEAPVFVATPPDVIIPELTTLTVTNQATDADLPANVLTYSLLNPPAGATIDANGIITWTPDEGQGPGTNHLVTVVSDGLLSVTNSFAVVVTEVNVPPVFVATPPDMTIPELWTLTVTNRATDADLPANVLTYSLVNPPAGATIGTNAVITWTPTSAQAGSSNLFVTVVNDGYVSVTNHFVVTVGASSALPLFVITAITVTNNVATVTWNSTGGATYVLQFKNSATDTNWTDVTPSVQATDASAWMSNAVNGATQQFYRVKRLQ
jgi:hypothetical protein